VTDPQKTMQEIVDILETDHKIGILLAAQMGATPQELQLIVQTAHYDNDAQTVTTEESFVIRCIGVQEHRVSLGMFNRLLVVEDHPLLWHHNSTYQEVYFRGQTDDVDGLMLELNQLYGQHYGIYRSLADDLNRRAPLGTILANGHGMLGEMPQPMAEKVKGLFERYGLSVSFLASQQHEPSPYDSKLVVIDDSYFIAHMFSADRMQPQPGN
jgi:hypothetical protein